jgi:hypothetical protein
MHGAEFLVGCRCARQRPKDSSAESRFAYLLDCSHNYSSYSLEECRYSLLLPISLLKWPALEVVRCLDLARRYSLTRHRLIRS